MLTKPPQERGDEVSICLIGESGDQANLAMIEHHLRSTYSWKVTRPIPCADEQVFAAFQTHRFLLLYWGSGKKGWYDANIDEFVEARLKANRRSIDVAGRVLR